MFTILNWPGVIPTLLLLLVLQLTRVLSPSISQIWKPQLSSEASVMNHWWKRNQSNSAPVTRRLQLPLCCRLRISLLLFGSARRPEAAAPRASCGGGKSASSGRPSTAQRSKCRANSGRSRWGSFVRWKTLTNTATNMEKRLQLYVLYSFNAVSALTYYLGLEFLLFGWDTWQVQMFVSPNILGISS